MELPILVYGDPLLRKVGCDIEKNFEGLDLLINNMFETMYKAKGVGLAAHQIGKAIRLFIVDTKPFSESDDDADDEFSTEERKNLEVFKKVFINARILTQAGKEWKFNEGCLSIPKIREDVTRFSDIEIEYYNEKFEKKVEKYNGLIARVIQHEYDHIEGNLFTDKISPFKRKLISGKLKDISIGKFVVDYKTRVFKQKK